MVRRHDIADIWVHSSRRLDGSDTNIVADRLVFVVMASRGVSDCGRVLLNACAPLRSESSAVLEGLLRALCPLLDLAKPLRLTRTLCPLLATRY